MKQIKEKTLAFLLALVMVVSTIAATPVATKADAYDGTAIVWVSIDSNGVAGTNSETVSIKKKPVFVEAGDVAQVVFEDVLGELDYEVVGSGENAYFNTINGLGWDTDTQKYWEFSVNGQFSMVGTGTYTVKDGDSISFVYKTYDEKLPDYLTDDVTLNPNKDAIQSLLIASHNKELALADYIYKNVFDSGKLVPTADDYSMIHTATVLKNCGYTADDFYLKIGQNLVNAFSDKEYLDSLTSTGKKVCVLARGIEFLGAPGMDYKELTTERFGGNDIIKELISRETYEASEYDYGAFGCEGYILKALDAVNYVSASQSGNDVTREELIEELASDLEYAIDCYTSWNTIDTLSMDIEALAPYANKVYADKMGISGDCYNYIQSVLGTAVRFICNAQAADGTFGGYDGTSSYNSLGVTMISLAKMGIDMATENDGYDIIKNGKTVFDAAAPFVDEENGTVADGVSYGIDQLLEGLHLANLVSMEANGVLRCEPEETTKPQTDKNEVVKKSIKKSKVTVSKATKKKNKIKVTLKKNAKYAKGYAVRVFTTKKLAKSNKAKKALLNKDVKTGKKTFKIKSKKFTKQKTLYIRVRAYTKINGNKVYAKKWSSVKKVF